VIPHVPKDAPETRYGTDVQQYCAHGTVLIAAYRYTPEFDASEAEAELICRMLIVATDATELSEATVLT
jgi:hypothetical protein